MMNSTLVRVMRVPSLGTPSECPPIAAGKQGRAHTRSGLLVRG
jgi:hypothetical protein